MHLLKMTVQHSDLQAIFLAVWLCETRLRMLSTICNNQLSLPKKEKFLDTMYTIIQVHFCKIDGKSVKDISYCV